MEKRKKRNRGKKEQTKSEDRTPKKDRSKSEDKEEHVHVGSIERCVRDLGRKLQHQQLKNLFFRIREREREIYFLSMRERTDECLS